MPKINIYVSQPMLAWLQEHPEVERSKEFQHRIQELQSGAPSSTGARPAAEPRRVRKLRVQQGKVNLRPSQTPVNSILDDDGMVTSLVVVE